ncbi:MAG TPA: ATP-binding protein [Gemmatimonadales bacterium]|nr:ATP-binding protein [Gemmatimonadales bacterium]
MIPVRSWRPRRSSRRRAVSSTSSGRAGTGLGLAIAKNIVEALGGAITVRSRPQEGTEVRIELPAAAVVR